MTHWSDSYIGRSYSIDDADCAALVIDVHADVFGGQVPADSQVTGLKRRVLLRRLLSIVAAPTDSPIEGDIVLMLIDSERDSHVGVYCVVDGEPCVLHAVQNAGQVVRTRLRQLRAVSGFAVAGYYKWAS